MAAAHAMSVMGVTGEIAGEKAAGSGSFQMHFLDAAKLIEKLDLQEYLQRGS